MSTRPHAGPDGRIHLLYVAPWLELGGTSKGTLDWFRWLDRDRFRLSLVTTQPSSNPWLEDVLPYVDEAWPLPELMAGQDMPGFILDFIDSRDVRLVHIMDSRLGYDLLPDIRTLPRRPATVVQLHVEEQHRAGYVRYVTTRYGNLVDAYSVTSRQLAETIIRDYDIPRGRCRVIYTGIDAEREFSPARVAPVAGLKSGPLHVAYPARLMEQKDPLLMVEVAAALADKEVDFRIHSLGDGELEPEVRAALKSKQLERRVLLHGPQRGVADWLAACDVMLLTSLFEGVPFVAFEAMAMGVPFAAPALPGLREIVGSDEAVLVDPRDDVQAYAGALETLARDAALRDRMGAAGRALVRDRYTIQRMAREHEQLYAELVEATAPPALEDPPPRPPPVRCRERPAYESPRVSVVVACFNDGHYLTGCIESLRRQTYPEIELIVIDDSSSEAGTLELLDRLDGDPDVTLIRQRENRGPGVARNAGIELATGRYILPMDADNLLLEDAIERLVEQLQGAGEGVAFIYPNLQFFGNRDDYYEVPRYNLYALLESNFCDTCSLFDRTVFDAGLRYSEDIRMAHEDWNFALKLAERGAYGQPARGKTLLFRKRGYSRGDTAWFGIDGAYRTGPHPPSLQDHEGAYGNLAAVKGRWSPALSVICLEPPRDDELPGIVAGIRRQSCPDAEVWLRSDAEVADSGIGPVVRRQPPHRARSSAEALAHGLEAARGRYVLVTAGNGAEMLRDPAFFEKVLRTFGPNARVGSLAFTDAGVAGRFPFRLLSNDDCLTPAPHTVAWRLAERRDLEEVDIGGDPVADTVRALSDAATVQWRHLPAPSRPRAQEQGGARAWISLGPQPTAGPAQKAEQQARLSAQPRLPAASEPPRRLSHSPTWSPAETMVLLRYRDPATERRMVTRDPHPPEGFELEYYLGVTWAFPLPGAARLTARGSSKGQLFEAAETTSERSLESPGLLGYVDRIAFPMLEPLELVRDPATGERTLVCGAEDPLKPTAEPLGLLGWIDSFPIAPKEAPHREVYYGVLGLVRTVDRDARRHRYGVGGAPSGEVSAELGSLLIGHPRGGVEVRQDRDGRVSTPGYSPLPRQASAADAARWAAAPVTWRDTGVPATATMRAVVRRSATGAMRLLSDHSRSGTADPCATEVVGFLHSKPGPGRLALYSSMHPVTGDQLLSTSRLEGNDMGYSRTTLLGHLVEQAPVTRRLGIRPAVQVPWASRFGKRARIT